MTSRRSLPLLVCVVVVTTLVLSGGAFSAVTTERGVQLAVVDDRDAFLGLQRATPLELPADLSLDRNVVRLTNQFASALEELAVSVTEEDESLPTVVDVDAPAVVGPGEAAWITADIDCGASGNEETVTLTIEASGRNAVELDREITIDCEEPSGAGPEVVAYEFEGCSEVRIVLASEPVELFEASFRIYDPAAGTTRVVNVSARPDELEPALGFDESARLYAFDVHEHLGEPGTGDGEILGAAVRGNSPTENSNPCADRGTAR